MKKLEIDMAQTAQAPGISIVSDNTDATKAWAAQWISLKAFLQALVTTMQAQETVQASA